MILLTGGFCLSACWDITPTPSRKQTSPGSIHPPGADTPPPGSRHPLGADTRWSRHPIPLGADTPPGSRHPARSRHSLSAEYAGRYGQRAGGTHPTGMQTCLNFFSRTCHFRKYHIIALFKSSLSVYKNHC